MSSNGRRFPRPSPHLSCLSTSILTQGRSNSWAELSLQTYSVFGLSAEAASKDAEYDVVVWHLMIRNFVSHSFNMGHQTATALLAQMSLAGFESTVYT